MSVALDSPFNGYLPTCCIPVISKISDKFGGSYLLKRADPLIRSLQKDSLYL